MASTALEKARQHTSSLRKRFAGQAPIRAVSAFGGGALVGTLERLGTVPATVMGLPTKPLLATAMYAFASGQSASGTAAAVAQGMGDGLLGAYGYAAGKGGTLIAGDDEVQGDAEDEALGLTG